MDRIGEIKDNLMVDSLAGIHRIADLQQGNAKLASCEPTTVDTGHRRGSKMVMLRIANPPMPVRFRPAPPLHI